MLLAQNDVNPLRRSTVVSVKHPVCEHQIVYILHKTPYTYDVCNA